LLPATVEIFVSAGKVEQARSACGELDTIAADVGAEFLGAIVAQARGTVPPCATGEASEALTSLRRAFSVFQSFDAPHLLPQLRLAAVR
jgi:hypothetical protein